MWLFLLKIDTYTGEFMKFAALIMALVFSVQSYAYNTEYSKLVPGKEILVDVANKEVISLTLETESQDSNARPTYSLVKEWSGFGCEYKQTLLLFSGFDFAKKTYKKTWEIQVTWTPGADLSGCIVKIAFPGMKDSRAELFMNY